MKAPVRIAFACTALLALLQPESASTQSLDLQMRLQKAKTLDCSFSKLVTGTWDGAAAKATVSSIEVEAKFHDIDIDGGTAEADSDFGKSFIVVRYA